MTVAALLSLNHLRMAQHPLTVTARSAATWQSMASYQEYMDRHASLSMNRLISGHQPIRHREAKGRGDPCLRAAVLVIGVEKA